MANSKATKKALFMSMLSLLLCFTMLMGATFAWFTDTVTSKNNRIVAGNLEVDLVMYDKATGKYESIADGNGDIFSEAAGNGINWEPGKTEIVYLGVRNNGSLALKYNVILNVIDGAIPLSGALEYAIIDEQEYEDGKFSSWKDVKAATEQVAPVPTGMGIKGAKDGVLDEIALNKTSGEIDYFALAVHMREEAGNEYQNGEITIDVMVTATQVDAEEDSFGKDYDITAEFENQGLPAAKVETLTGDELVVNVRGLANIGNAGIETTLDAGFQFEPTETLESIAESEYKYYHADFVVYADRDVSAESLALAGYYKAYCDLIDGDWIALSSPDDILAGTKIRLVGGMGVTVNYEEICKYGNDGTGFQCGVINLDEANVGTTLTVELRLYETTKNGAGFDVETGNYITIGTVTHKIDTRAPEIITYDSATMGGLYEYLPTLEDGETLILPAATYTVGGTLTIPAGVTIAGEEGAEVIFHQNSAAQDDIFNCEGDAIIRNITFESNRKGYAVAGNAENHDGDGDITIENCKFKGIASEKNWGVYKNLNGNLTIKNCTFDNYNNAICGVNNGNGSTTIITGCTFTNISDEAIGYVTSSMPADFETNVIANNTGLTADNVIGY